MAEMTSYARGHSLSTEQKNAFFSKKKIVAFDS